MSVRYECTRCCSSFPNRREAIAHQCKGLVQEDSKESSGSETAVRIGQHWLEVALERINAGEPEQHVMLDYGYLRVSNRGNDQ